MPYEGQDKINWEQGKYYLPQLKYSLPYDTPTAEEDQTATGSGIPYTNALANAGGGGGGGGGGGLDLTYTQGAKANVPATFQGDYDIEGKKINELGRTGILGAWDQTKDFFSKFNQPRVRGTLGTRLSDQPRIPLPASMMSWSLSPFNTESRNYNKNFAEQLNFLEGSGAPGSYIGRDQGSGHLRYGPDSVLSGQNVFSGFGSNDYEEQLEKKKEWFEKRKLANKMFNKTKYQQTLDEITAWQNSPDNPANKNKPVTDNQAIIDQMKINNATQPTGGGMSYNQVVDAMVQDRSESRRGKPGGIGGKELMASGGRAGYNRGRVVNPGGYAGEDEGGILEWIKSKMGSESETNPTVFGTQNSLLNQGVITQLQDAIKTYEALMHMGDLDEEQQDDYELKLSQLQALIEGAEQKALGGRAGFFYGGLATIL